MSPLDKMKAYAKMENKRMLARIGGSHAVAGWKGRDGGYSGGRPSKKPDGTIKLSKKAERILLCLKSDMKVTDIAQAVGTSHQAVSQIISKYNLKELANEQS